MRCPVPGQEYTLATFSQPLRGTFASKESANVREPRPIPPELSLAPIPAPLHAINYKELPLSWISPPIAGQELSANGAQPFMDLRKRLLFRA